MGHKSLVKGLLAIFPFFFRGALDSPHSHVCQYLYFGDAQPYIFLLKKKCSIGLQGKNFIPFLGAVLQPFQETLGAILSDYVHADKPFVKSDMCIEGVTSGQASRLKVFKNISLCWEGYIALRYKDVLKHVIRSIVQQVSDWGCHIVKLKDIKILN